MEESPAVGHFAEILKEQLTASGYNSCQLARLAGLPRRTIANWLDGIVKKPRHWTDVIKLAVGLRLTAHEANRLLAAAGYSPLTHLQAQTQNEAERLLLAFWAEERATPKKPAPFQAIADLPTFVGREAALANMQTWVQAEQHPAPTILAGMVEVGKTVLAARLAYELRAHFSDGVLWARLDTTPPLTILRQFAEAYGEDVSAYEDVDSRSAVVRSLLADKRVLVVLDNVASSQQIEPLMPPSGSGAVLITSRRRNLALPTAHRLYLDTFSPETSLALMAKILEPERVVREEKLLLKMAELVGHLPLAIDIVASRLVHEPDWKTAEFLSKLQAEKSVLNALADEGRCVRSAVMTSFHLLSPEQQQFFAALGQISEAEFTVETTATVANTSVSEATAVLTELFCLSFVRRGQNGRYRLIPLLRAFAQEQMGKQLE